MCFQSKQTQFQKYTKKIRKKYDRPMQKKLSKFNYRKSLRLNTPKSITDLFLNQFSHTTDLELEVARGKIFKVVPNALKKQSKSNNSIICVHDTNTIILLCFSLFVFVSVKIHISIILVK